MNVVIHTVFGQLYLHLAAFLCGISLFFVYLFGKNIVWISLAVKSPRFERFKPFFQRLKCAVPGRAVSFVNDILICVLGAFLLLCATFILNSGNFRLFTVVTLVLGFCFGKAILTLVSEAIIITVIYVVKFALDVVLFPLRWLTGKIILLVKQIYESLLNRHRQRQIRRYTEYCFRSANEYAKYGFADKYYKELLK